MPRRQALVFGAAGCLSALVSVCQRRAASPPSGLRPSPSHRYAAGPSLYKRGCLWLRNSPAASRPSVPPANGPGLRSPPVCKTPPPAHGSGLATASRVQNGPSCPRPLPAIASRVQNAPFYTRLRPATASRVQNSPSCPRLRPTGEPGGDGRWSEGRK